MLAQFITVLNKKRPAPKDRPNFKYFDCLMITSSLFVTCWPVATAAIAQMAATWGRSVAETLLRPQRLLQPLQRVVQGVNLSNS